MSSRRGRAHEARGGDERRGTGNSQVDTNTPESNLAAAAAFNLLPSATFPSSDGLANLSPRLGYRLAGRALTRQTSHPSQKEGTSTFSSGLESRVLSRY